MRTPIAVAVGLALVTASSAALAQPAAGYTETKDISGQVVVFNDNPLDGTTMDPNGAILKGVHKSARMVLMRPRLNFVTELYKSIEKM